MVAAITQAATITYTDKLKRVVNVSAPAKRAVIFISYELIPVLDIWDRVAGVGRFAYQNDLMKAVKPDIERSLPSVGSGSDINIEALLNLKPDLVITWTSKPDNIRFMEEKGLKVIGIYPESLSELYDVMRMHGKVFSKEKPMELTIAQMEEIFKMVKERASNIPSHKRRKVLWLGGKPTSVACAIGVTNDVFKLIGGINPASSIPQRNADVPMERIIAWDPEVIFIWGNARYKASDILNHSQWRSIRAVKEGRVYKAPDWSTWSPRLAPIALWMGVKAYPEYFQEVNLDRMLEDFYQKVFNISYKRVKPIEEQ